MAITRVFNAKGWTPHQDDALIERMNLGGHAAPGVLEHWVAVTAEGMYGLDGYESREVADHLAQQKIGPLVQELELPPPTSSDCEVDALLEPQN